jgi:hypothetical protein
VEQQQQLQQQQQCRLLKLQTKQCLVGAQGQHTAK